MRIYVESLHAVKTHLSSSNDSDYVTCKVVLCIDDRHISHLPQSRGGARKLADGPPCVVLASPGMLQSGLSRELLEYWAPDAKNGLVVTGYSVEGTLARVSR